jgi:hypothetical protein
MIRSLLLALGFAALLGAGLTLDAHGAACGWSAPEQAGAYAATALTLADWAQTRVIAADRPTVTTRMVNTPDGPERRTRTEPGFHESNPLLGERPDAHAVNAYFAGLVLGGLALGCLLPPESRGAWLWLWAGMELQAVVSNHWRGVRITGSF